MFEAIVFLAGAVLFFLAVVYFVILWQDRVSLARRHSQLQADLANMKEQRIDLEIRERELWVWAAGLEHQQRAIAQAEEELRMLTASKQPPEGSPVGNEQGTQTAVGDRTRGAAASRWRAVKNVKQDDAVSKSGKLLT